MHFNFCPEVVNYCKDFIQLSCVSHFVINKVTQLFVELRGARPCNILKVYLGQYTYRTIRFVSPDKTFSGS